MQVVIIGNGIAGVTCARYIRKNSDANITIISGESLDFFSRPALMYLYMGHMKFEHTLPYPSDFWHKNRINRIQDWVVDLEISQRRLTLASGTHLSWDKLVIACGSIPARLGVSGEHLPGIQSFYHLNDLHQLQRITPTIQKAIVIGGGLIGVELAEMLHYREKEVHMLIREKCFGEHLLPKNESNLIHKHIGNKGVQIHPKTTVKAFEANDNKYALSLNTHKGSKIDTDFAGVCIGVKPNIEWLNHLPLYNTHGIEVNEHFETKFPAIYAIGDCAYLSNPPLGFKARETMWYTGKIQGMQAAFSILGMNTSFQFPVWYNSAKFFDIEYQVYGYVPHDLEDNLQYKSQLWEDSNKQSILRVVWDAESNALTGIHGLGIRLRQEVISAWISAKKSYEQVLPNLKEAIFDSEFTKKFL